MADYIRYANQKAGRNQPLNQDLVKALSYLGDMGITAEVFSGGVDPGMGALSRSGRHVHGGAGDMRFYQGDRRLNWANPDDLPLFRDIVAKGKAAGITGFGAGPGYMGEGSMHVGFGNPGVWGAGGKGANAPDWLRAAYNGTELPASVAQAPATKGLTLSSQPEGVQKLAAAGRVPSYDSLMASQASATTPTMSGGASAGIGASGSATATAGVEAPSVFDTFKNEGFQAGMKALGKNADAMKGVGALAGLFGGGNKGGNDGSATIDPAQGIAATESADAGRAQAAQQLMSVAMNARMKRPGIRGLSLMG